MRTHSGKQYPAELRSFALTLNFFSSSAYSYVRSYFGKALPHPRTLSKWYGSVDGTPGYTAEALRAIKIKAQIEKEKGKRLVGCLVMDEMAIKQQIHWTGSRNDGYIDFGTGIKGNDSLPVAKNVLVFMLVGVNAHWKIPIAYFLIDSVSAEDKANLVKGCLLQLESSGVLIKALTFDGCAANLAMCNVLGQT